MLTLVESTTDFDLALTGGRPVLACFASAIRRSSVPDLGLGEFADLERERLRVVSVDTDRLPELANRYSLPSRANFILFKGDTQVCQWHNNVTAKTLSRALDELVCVAEIRPAPTPQTAHRRTEVVSAGPLTGEMTIYAARVRTEDEHLAVPAGYSRMLVMIGEKWGERTTDVQCLRAMAPNAINALQILGISLSNADVEILARLAGLNFLALADTSISASGIAQLAELKNLRRLNIENTGKGETSGPDQAAVASLRAALPATRINGRWIAPALLHLLPQDSATPGCSIQGPNDTWTPQHITAIDAATDLDVVLATESRPVLVHFASERANYLAHELDEFASRLRERVRVLSVDLDKQRELDLRYSLAGAPTLVLFHSGTRVLEWCWPDDPDRILPILDELSSTAELPAVLSTVDDRDQSAAAIPVDALGQSGLLILHPANVPSPHEAENESLVIPPGCGAGLRLSRDRGEQVSDLVGLAPNLLDSLIIDRIEMCDSDIELIASMTGLSQLTLIGTQLSAENIAHLDQLTFLTDLRILASDGTEIDQTTLAMLHHRMPTTRINDQWVHPNLHHILFD